MVACFRFLVLVLFLDEPGSQYPAFAAPSLVRLCEGKLFFGRRAMQSAAGKLFESLKVSLLPPPSMKKWDEGEFPRGTTPDLLVAIYLSWILGRIKAAVGEERGSLLSLNVAAPMNHVEDQALKERYLQVVHAAWQAAIDNFVPPVTQGAALAQLGPAFNRFLDRPVPPREKRRFEILPETLAPLASLLKDPKTQAGLYMMVDMGAGTTELSVSHMSQRSDDGVIACCYWDKSVLFGGDQFSNNDRQNGARRVDHSREESKLKDTLRSEFRKVWYAGFGKDKHGGHSAKYKWKELNVVLAGGGFRRQGLQELIEASSPLDEKYFLDPTEYSVNWHSPADLAFDGAPPGFVLRDPLDSPAYLAVAHGLSLERMQWPKFYYPVEVEVLRSEPRGENQDERSYSDSDVG